MKGLSERIARDPSISERDFWRALQTIEGQLHQLGSQGKPIPIDLIFARAILRRACQSRQQG
ncbi:hypothetical protein [Chelativorans sp.]|uniref:hypothetical protein n=1 Tax=Chelativorans sp. TaxID=2203393 RepID=UPI00281107BF|nr:hypothetical protein [Chelativorans sp.]